MVVGLGFVVVVNAVEIDVAVVGVIDVDDGVVVGDVVVVADVGVAGVVAGDSEVVEAFQLVVAGFRVARDLSIVGAPRVEKASCTVEIHCLP